MAQHNEFGKKGEALVEKARNPCCISFEGAGGYVAVFVVEEENPFASCGSRRTTSRIAQVLDHVGHPCRGQNTKVRTSAGKLLG